MEIDNGVLTLTRIVNDMKQLKTLLSLIFLMLTILPPQTALADIETDVQRLHWIDLIPEQERNIPTKNLITEHTGGAALQSQAHTVRQELDGTEVKIAGFVIPLEGDDELVTDFLLVPYFGACIHIPPPPPNQIIRVRFKEGVAISEIWDVVYVVGMLRTESSSSELADTAYVIDGSRIETYQ
ncbi:hypothetical protein VME0621_03570 [Vibrio mediterranei]|nr:hypothetical protein VME0621_03570 [Vibrio mediterranei]